MPALTALTALLQAGRKPLWLDYHDYAALLLNKGAQPWLDVAACVAWQRKAQGLLNSDVLTLPVAAVCAAWLDAHPALRQALASKRRTGFALRTLLADEALRALLVELAQGLRASFVTLPLALACSAPCRWLAQAYHQAHGQDPAGLSDDDTDSAAVYMADFLRCFGDVGIDILLLQEAPDAEPARPEQLALYQPVFNVAAHYRWEPGLCLPAGPSPAGLPSAGFVIAPAATAAGSGALVPSVFWDGAAPPDCPGGGFRYAVIPAQAQPETVLRKLAELRA